MNRDRGTDLHWIALVTTVMYFQCRDPIKAHHTNAVMDPYSISKSGLCLVHMGAETRSGKTHSPSRVITRFRTSLRNLRHSKINRVQESFGIRLHNQRGTHRGEPHEHDEGGTFNDSGH